MRKGKGKRGLFELWPFGGIQDDPLPFTRYPFALISTPKFSFNRQLTPNPLFLRLINLSLNSLPLKFFS